MPQPYVVVINGFTYCVVIIVASGRCQLTLEILLLIILNSGIIEMNQS